MKLPAEYPWRTESALQSAIVEVLRTAGYWVIRTGVSMKRGGRGTQSGEPGMPDLCLPGRGWLEVKLLGRELDPAQVAWHAKAREHRVKVAVVVTPLGALDVVKEWGKAYA